MVIDEFILVPDSNLSVGSITREVLAGVATFHSNSQLSVTFEVLASSEKKIK